MGGGSGKDTIMKYGIRNQHILAEYRYRIQMKYIKIANGVQNLF